MAFTASPTIRPGTHRSAVLGAALVATLATAACSSVSNNAKFDAMVKETDCAGLSAELRQADERRQAAEESRGNSWKLVLPILVAARYASAHSSVSDAEAQMAQIRQQQDAKECNAVAVE